jgi:hypothetical protein
MRDSGLPADVLVGKLKKDITHALDAAQRAAEDEEFALNEAGWDAFHLRCRLRERKLISIVRRDCLAIPTRLPVC